jgi:two-component system NarL family response regulator
MCSVNAGESTAEQGEAIRVVIADDHVLYRRGLQTVVMQEDDIDIVGEAGDGQEAIDRTVELLPDVVLMDVRMPRTSGIEACAAIKSMVPSTKIIMLTMSDEESDLYEAVKAGANGYLLKDVPRGDRRRHQGRPSRRLPHLAVDGLEAAGRVRPDEQEEPGPPDQRRCPAADRA